MKELRFAVVDVETTGGYAGDHRVTEVGIAISNGSKILDTYRTLINPQKSIPRHIEALTGISDAMVADAPLFTEKQQEINAYLKDAVFVAHNVNFDFSFIRNEMALTGVDFRSKKLCTARYARSLLQDQRGFSLRKLAQRFGIVNDQPHRALSDAITAAEILHRLIEIDNEGLIKKKISRLQKEVKLPLYLPPEKYHNIPNVPGIYVMYNASGKPIYIGKAKNIKQRITQHFAASDDARTQAFMHEVSNLETFAMGTELMALIKEDVEIRKYWPKHNRSQKQINMGFHVVAYPDHKGINHLGIKRARAVQDALATFQNKRNAMLWLQRKVEQHQLNPKWSGMAWGWEDFEEPTIEEHNTRLQVLKTTSFTSEADIVLRLQGRNSREKGFIWIQKEQVQAIGFAPLEINWDDKEQLEAHSDKVYPSARINQLAMGHLLSKAEADWYLIDS